MRPSGQRRLADSCAEAAGLVQLHVNAEDEEEGTLRDNGQEQIPPSLHQTVESSTTTLPSQRAPSHHHHHHHHHVPPSDVVRRLVGCCTLFLLAFFVLGVLAATMVEIVYNFTDSQPCVSSASYHLGEGIAYAVTSLVFLVCDTVLLVVIPNAATLRSVLLRMVRTSPLYLLVAYFVFYGYQLYAHFPTDHMTRGVWAVVYVLALAANLTALLLTMGWNYVRKGSISRIHQGLVVSLIMIQMLGKIILTAFYEVNLLKCLNGNSSNLGTRLTEQLAIVAYFFYAIILFINMGRHMPVHTNQQVYPNFFKPLHAAAEHEAILDELQALEPFGLP